MDDTARVGRIGGLVGIAAALLFGRRKRRTEAGPQPVGEPRNPDTRVEGRDAPLWLFSLLAGLAAGLIALAVLSLMVIFPDTLRDQPKRLATPMPEPRLQVDPAADLRAMRAEIERKFHGYGWADREHGIARIPIEEAMGLVARQGIPDWPEDAR